MGQVIVDTSVWVDCFRAIQNSQTQFVANRMPFTGQIALVPTILQEVLQGIRDDNKFMRVRTDLLACAVLRLEPVKAAIGAADMYRMLRKKGVTIRKPNDCLIAHYAIVYNTPILHNDVDFEQIAQHTPLQCLTV